MCLLLYCSTSGGYWVVSHGQNFKVQKFFWTNLSTLSSSTLATGNRNIFWCGQISLFFLSFLYTGLEKKRRKGKAKATNKTDGSCDSGIVVYLFISAVTWERRPFARPVGFRETGDQVRVVQSFSVCGHRHKMTYLGRGRRFSEVVFRFFFKTYPFNVNPLFSAVLNLAQSSFYCWSSKRGWN